jgi:hypothetical protein
MAQLDIGICRKGEVPDDALPFTISDDMKNVT